MERVNGFRSSILSSSDLRAMSLADDVLDGLTRPFKELPAKHLYDARGSELFEAITELPEYYPTRTERALLVEHADAIVGDRAPSSSNWAPAPRPRRACCSTSDASAASSLSTSPPPRSTRRS